MRNPIWIKYALDVPAQCPQNTDPSMHQWPAILSPHDEGFRCGLPFIKVLFRLRQFYDVVGRVL
jgi:hypothetical protein